MSKRRLFYRLHIWLSWIVGLQVLIWIATGLYMSLQPIELVRAEHLAREPARLDLRGLAVRSPADVLRRETKPVEALRLKTWLGRPTYEIHYADGRAAMVDALSGKRITPLTRSGAEMAARAAYSRDRPVADARLVDPKAIPLDFRRDEPAWAVRFATETNAVFYVSAETGEVLARRTTRWRLYDFMWGLHIMDWGGRENFNNPWVIIAGGLALALVSLGAALLFLRPRWGP